MQCFEVKGKNKKKLLALYSRKIVITDFQKTLLKRCRNFKRLWGLQFHKISSNIDTT